MLFVKIGDVASDSLYSCSSPTPLRAGTAAACTSTLLTRALRRCIGKRTTAGTPPRRQLAILLARIVPLNIAEARKCAHHVAGARSSLTTGSGFRV